MSNTMKTIKIGERKFKVDKVPMPSRGRGRPPIFTLLIDKMEVGDSILFETPKEAWALQQAAYKKGIPVSQFKEAGGIRVFKKELPLVDKNIEQTLDTLAP